MAITENQINDNFQKQIGRAPTPYEINKYSTASIQDLTNLKGTYAKYNPEQSIVDYLAYQGQDPSIKARTDLANMHGITGYTGSFSQNVELLKKMKSGTPTAQPVPGTVAGATPAVAPDYDKQTGLLTDAGRAKGLPEVNANKTDGSIPGSVAGAVNQTDSTNNTETTSPTDSQSSLPPELQTAQQSFNDAQRAVLGVTKQIDEINSTLDRTLQDKRDEIARSGGVVNESQLRSTVLAENAPLLQERRDLLSQRSQLVGEQNIAGKNYTDLQNNYYKNLSVEQNQQRIDETKNQNDIKNKQFEQSLEQKNIKYLKFTDPITGEVSYKDQSTGNTITQSSLTPSTATVASDKAGNSAIAVNNVSGIMDTSGHFVQYNSTQEGFNATIDKITQWQGGHMGLTANSTLKDFVNTWITGKKEGTSAPQGYTAENVAKALGVQTSAKFGSIDPVKLATVVANFETGYESQNDALSSWNPDDESKPSTNSVIANKPDPMYAGRTQNDIWNDAIKLSLDKTYTAQKAVGGLSGGKVPIQNFKSALENKSSALISASGVNSAMLQSEYNALTSAQKKQVDFMANTSRALLGAETGATLTQKLFQDRGINVNDSTFLNKTVNDLTSLFGDSGDIRAYRSAMVEIGNEYAQVFARGGQRSVEGNTLAQNVINGNVKLEDIQTTLDTLQEIGKTVVQSSIDTVKNISNGVGTENVSNFMKFLATGNKDNTTDSINQGIKQYTPIKFEVPAKYNYNYERDYQQAQQAVDGGADPATVWGHFNTLYN